MDKENTLDALSKKVGGKKGKNKFEAFDKAKKGKEEDIPKMPPAPQMPIVEEEDDEILDETKIITAEQNKVEDEKELKITDEVIEEEEGEEVVLPEPKTFEDYSLDGDTKGDKGDGSVVKLLKDEVVEEVQEAKTENQTGGIRVESVGRVVKDIDFDGDDYLKNETDDLYRVKGVNTLEIPVESKSLYQLKINNDNVEAKINEFFNENPKVVSFGIEEIGLNNRLVEMTHAERDFTDFIIIKSKLGNIAVHKTRQSHSGIGKVFMEEAIRCIENGERIEIPLKEVYGVVDKHDEKFNRERFRASFAEIKDFIKETKMNGKVTKHGYLIINE